MHIFFAYTTKTFAFKSVVFQRHWGTELFFHAKVCISLVSGLFKETCPVKWKPSVHQFINEHCQYQIKKNQNSQQQQKNCRSLYFYQLLKLPVGNCNFLRVRSMPQKVQHPRRHQGAGFQIQLQQALLTLHPKSVSLCWALILCCLLLVFSLGSSITLLVSCSVSCPSSHFCLDIYLAPGCPPASVDCCNEWLWYLPYFIPTTFWITEIQPFGIFTHFSTLSWVPGCRICTAQ